MAVTALDDDAAVTLLDMELRAVRPLDDRITGDRVAAEQLAGVCGRLPLTLQIIAGMLKADPELSVGELADELRVEQERYDDGAWPGASSVTATLELAYGRLTKTAARTFRLLPVNPGPDVSTAAAAVLMDLSAYEMRPVLAGLAQACLAEAVPSVEGRWRMPDLVRLYAQQLSDAYAEADGREQARDRLLSYYLNMAEAADAYLRVLPGMAVPKEFTSWDDALGWLDAERASLTAAVQMAADTGCDVAAMSLPLLLAQYLAWQRLFDDLLATTTISLRAAQRLGDRYHQADALTNLGGALREVRRFEEAVTAHQDAAAIFRETGDRQAEAEAVNNLGLALKAMRRFEEAVTAHQDAAAIFRETGDRHGEGDALNNLGLALQACGRLEEAISALQDARAKFSETGDRYGQGIALNNLGSALCEVGRFEEAITAHGEAIAIFGETGDRYNEGIAHENLERARVAQLA